MRSGTARWSLILVLLVPCCLSAQQPFNTDDADVTDYHTWHVEASNEYDWLQTISYPNLRQNTFNVKFAYGLLPGLEVGGDNQLLSIYNAPDPVLPRLAFGYGDFDFSAKYNFHKEHEGSKWPAMTVDFSVEFPTGDARKQLGSGLTDYYLYGVLQKSLTDRTKLRMNGGIVLAGNTLTGAVGLRTRGTVYIGAASMVRDFTKRLKLGAEVTGAVTSNFDLGRGQLQGQVGGNYELRKDLTLDFGVIAGTFVGSPRVGAQVGFSYNFPRLFGIGKRR